MWYRTKIASPINEGMSNFGYKDIITTDDYISQEELLENIKDFYIKQCVEHDHLNNNHEPQFLADFIEELNLMWQEYIDDIQKQDETATKQVMIIASDYLKTLPESEEKQMLENILSSENLFQDLMRKS